MMTSTRSQIIARHKQLGWSARELARRSGVSAATVAAYLAGRADVTTEKADAMVKAMQKHH